MKNPETWTISEHGRLVATIGFQCELRSPGPADLGIGRLLVDDVGWMFWASLDTGRRLSVTLCREGSILIDKVILATGHCPRCSKSLDGVSVDRATSRIRLLHAPD